jgi:hypothetical protein
MIRVYRCIIFAMSTNGNPIMIAIPSSCCVETEDMNYVTIWCVSTRRYKVLSRTEQDLFDGKHEFEVITVEIHSGLHMIGESIHAGANKLCLLTNEELPHWNGFVLELDNLLKDEKNIQGPEVLNLMQMYSMLDKLFCFFAKTNPINHPVPELHNRIYCLDHDICDYVNDFSNEKSMP